jgi:hypothetical protein
LTRRAIAVNPSVPDFHANLGHALRDSGDLVAAEASYREADWQRLQACSNKRWQARRTRCRP